MSLTAAYRRIYSIFDFNESTFKIDKIFVLETKRMYEKDGENGEKLVKLETHLPQVVAQCVAM